jgi:hypothetical protein
MPIAIVYQLLVMLAVAVEASQIGHHLCCSVIIVHHQTSQLLGQVFIAGVLQTSLIAAF